MILEVSNNHDCKLDKISRNCYFDQNLRFSSITKRYVSLQSLLQNEDSFL